MKLRLALVPSALTQPILDGDVRDSELDLDLSTGSADPNSRRMLAGELDAAEMSIATCVQTYSRGRPFVALPVFMARRFLQPCVLIAAPSPIRKPSDLAGARVGLPQYWVTSSIWHRLLLQHRYNVAIGDVSWVTVMPERLAGFPAGIRARFAGDRSLDELLRNDEVDAVFEARPPNRSGRRFLFEDPVAASLDYFRMSGVCPLIHTVAVRTPVVEDNPDLPRRLFELFVAAKAWAYEHYASDAFESPIGGMTFEACREAMGGGDLYPYGMQPNRKTIDALLSACLEQGVTDVAVPSSELFHAVASSDGVAVQTS